MFRAISLYFVIMLVLVTSAVAWNVPFADYNSTNCCFSQTCWNQKPSSGCTFTAKDMPSWDWYSKEWRSYSQDGHIFLLQNGIRLLEEKGYDNWAAYLSEGDHFQALADGVTWADTFKGRWWGRLYVTAFFGAFKKQVVDDIDLCNMAGFDHYYSDFVSSPAGNGLKNVDEGQIASFIVDDLGGLVSGIALNLVLAHIAPFIPVIGPIIQALQAIGMVGLSFEFIPSLDSSYPSAAVQAEQWYDQSVSAYSSSYNPAVQFWDYRSAEYNSLFQIGWATHYVQDTAVIYHLHDIWSSLLNPHNTYEDDLNGLGDPSIYPDYHVTEDSWTIAANYDSLSVMQIAQQGAMAVDDAADWEKAKSEDSILRKEALKNGLKVSEQMTAAILAKYMIQIGIPQKVPTFSGYVRDTITGEPVGNAYVFYREKLGFSGDPDAPGGIQAFIDQQKPWNYVRTDWTGKYSLNLIGGRVYYIRAEHPAYQYSGFINISTKEPMGQQITSTPVEFKQPLPGEAMSGIDYTLYLSPRKAGEIFPPSPLLLNATFLPLTVNLTSATARYLEQAILSVRADTTSLAAQAPGEAYPLTLPNETYIDIEVANLINLGNGEVVTSASQLTSLVSEAGPEWRRYEKALKAPEQYQIISERKTTENLLSHTPLQVEASNTTILKPIWQFSINPQFNDPTEPLQLSERLQLISGAVPLGTDAAIDTGLSPLALERMKNVTPKTQIVLTDQNLSETTLLSYAFGRLPIIDSGQPLYENRLARVPAPNVQIEVTLDQSSDWIGPEFNVFPSFKKSPSQDIGNQPVHVPDAALTLVNAQITPTTGSCSEGYTPIPDPQGNVICIPAKPATSSTAKQLTLLTNSEGKAAFILKSGNQAGLIRLHIRMLDNPTASGIKPSETLDMVVYPPITWIESSSNTVVLPTLGSVSPRYTLQSLYTLPVIDQPMTHVETGLCLNFSDGADQTIHVNLLKCQPVPVIYRPDFTVPSRLPENPSILSPLISVWNFVISIPEKVGSLFFGKPEQAPVQGEVSLVQNCDDHNACTINDHYIDGVCHGDPISCTDQNPETTEFCDPAQGCIFAPFLPSSEGSACDDGNLCTRNDRITGGICIGSPVICDDGNPGTGDTCVSTQGCVFTPLPSLTTSGECTDDNLCTVDDRWANGVCKGEPFTCDDGNPETQDSCDPESGCIFTPMLTTPAGCIPCNDGNACTMNDCMIRDVCTGSPLICDDGNPETQDSCDPEQGCIFTPILTTTTPAVEYIPCDDGNACTENDRIIRDVCRGTQIVCDDGDPRTQDTCDPISGCVYSRITITTTTPSEVCPEGCTCLSPSEALRIYGHALRCSDTPCAADYSSIIAVQYKYCYRAAG